MKGRFTALFLFYTHRLGPGGLQVSFSEWIILQLIRYDLGPDIHFSSGERIYGWVIRGFRKNLSDLITINSSNMSRFTLGIQNWIGGSIKLFWGADKLSAVGHTCLFPDMDSKGTIIDLYIFQNDTGSGIKVSLFQRCYNIFSI